MCIFRLRLARKLASINARQDHLHCFLTENVVVEVFKSSMMPNDAVDENPIFVFSEGNAVALCTFHDLLEEFG
jgi:hypothetical protein